ncbi:MAG: pitrilysin family protein, partial [Patescibacteria group bacterium]
MKNLNFEKLETSAGVPLYVMSLPHANTVAAGVLVKAGTRDEIWPKEAGLAHALEHMVFQGTKMFKNSKNVSAYIEEIGGVLNTWTWSECTFFWNRVPEKHKERSVILNAEEIKNCTIPESKIKTEMLNIVEEIRMRKDNPQSYVGKLADEFLYKEHPLGKDTLGTEESVKSFKKENFIEFRKRYYHPANYTFITAGKITPEEAVNLFNRHFPEKSKKPANQRVPEKIIDNKKREAIYKKEIDQVNLILSAPLGSSNEKSSKAIDLFTTMLDGGMSFPLFQEVRDKRGLCYSISAGATRFSDVGNFYIYIGTDPKRYQEAIKISLAVIEKSKSNKTLLRKAKEVELGRLALKYENT